MSRTSLIVLIALGATFAGFVLASNAQRLSDDEPETAPSVAAGPQTATLDWRETHGSDGERLVFTVDQLDVTATGLYALAQTLGSLSVVSVVGSLYPVTTVLLARGLLGERLRRVQGIGVVLALCGVALIASG